MGHGVPLFWRAKGAIPFFIASLAPSGRHRKRWHPKNLSPAGSSSANIHKQTTALLGHHVVWNHQVRNRRLWPWVPIISHSVKWAGHRLESINTEIVATAHGRADSERTNPCSPPLRHAPRRAPDKLHATLGCSAAPYFGSSCVRSLTRAPCALSNRDKSCSHELYAPVSSGCPSTA